MSNDQPKLTLERWAALDAQASPGPWFHFEGLTDEESGQAGGVEQRVCRELESEETGQPTACGVLLLDDFGKKADLALAAASRQAPTRLLAALRGLAREWDEKESQHASSDYGMACAYEACAAQLRHLIATNDLAATTTCQHDFQANYGLYDTNHRYCTRCGVAE